MGTAELQRVAVVRVAGHPGLPTSLHARRRGTLVARLLDRLTRVTWLDHLALWTDDPVLASTHTGRGGFVIEAPVPRTPTGTAARFVPSDWPNRLGPALERGCGTAGTIRCFIDGQYLLLHGATLEAMYDALLEDPSTHLIHLAHEAAPHLYIKHPVTGAFAAVWDQPGLDRQAYPMLYHRLGVWIHHAIRPRSKLPMREAWHVIPWCEGFTFDRDEDLPFAEYVLSHDRDLRSVA